MSYPLAIIVVVVASLAFDVVSVVGSRARRDQTANRRTMAVRSFSQAVAGLQRAAVGGGGSRANQTNADDYAYADTETLMCSYEDGNEGCGRDDATNGPSQPTNQPTLTVEERQRRERLVIIVIVFKR